uniref:Uncharacterized protein n=1 Tax=Arundo donax TaxID=35708 RepID=A0A0A9BIY0_ARUDO
MAPCSPGSSSINIPTDRPSRYAGIARSSESAFFSLHSAAK